jgi:hypothetical protein
MSKGDIDPLPDPLKSLPARPDILPLASSAPHATIHESGVVFARIGPAVHPVSLVSRDRPLLLGMGGAWACRASPPAFFCLCRTLVLGFPLDVSPLLPG